MVGGFLFIGGLMKLKEGIRGAKLCNCTVISVRKESLTYTWLDKHVHIMDFSGGVCPYIVWDKNSRIITPDALKVGDTFSASYIYAGSEVESTPSSLTLTRG